MRRFSIGLLALFLSAAAPAEPAHDPTNTTELVGALEQTYKGVTSLKADFVQVQRSAATGEVRQKGVVQLKRPRKARWEFQGADGTTFVTDGKTIWLYTPSAKQVIETGSASGAGGGGMGELLDSLDKLDQFFNLQLVEGQDGKRSYRVIATPKSPAQYKQLEIVVSRKSYTVEKVVVVDQMGGQTELTFSSVKLNSDVPDTAFTFSVPAGVQVIKGAM